ncbi:SubName: Full=Probable Chitin deacetylase {ECO:0000313/EMBL:CCA71793.1} [Serendipita indica DSM 11827]|nr:SubName: Full=Probable Chitin deacetylase {ECO:0000313/EMBL:CCA71793.1} [Serendipita indica DSM 11827]
MLFRALVSASLPLLAFGAQIRRQDPAASSSAAGTTPAGTGTATPAATSMTPPPEVPITLVSTNPTAFPLSAIVATPVTHTAQPLASTPSAGQQPSAVGSNAPPLPAANSIVIANYPALDKTPPTDSPEVKQWIQDVANSGIPIPTLPLRLREAARQTLAVQEILPSAGGLVVNALVTLTLPPAPTNLLGVFLSMMNLHSTFFVVGSRALSRPEILQAEYMAGHQISVHTWSHSALTTLTNEQIIAELGWTAKIIKDVTGVTPNTFRAPYGDIDDRVRAIGRAMGFTSIIWTGYTNPQTNQLDNFDTNDWHIAAGTVSASGVIAAFENILQSATLLNTGFIVLAHDLYQQSVDLAIGYILPDALARRNPQFKMMSIIECLGMPLANAYKETNDNATNPVPTGINQSISYAGASAAATSTAGHTGGALSTSPSTLWHVVGLAGALVAAYTL